jgi:hypothetical protein
MKRYCCIILSVMVMSLLLLAGCTPDGNGTGEDNIPIHEELSTASNFSASKNLDGEVMFFPTFDENYKTGSNEMFAFWFDIPVEWNAVDRSEDGSEYTILTGNDKVDIRIYGQLIDGPEDGFYRQLAGQSGEITEFVYRDDWVGRKINVSGNEMYFVRVDGDSYLILHIDASKDPGWLANNDEMILYIARSTRMARESFGRMVSESNLITPDDLKLGNLEPGMTYEKLLSVMGQEPVDKTEEEYHGMKAEMLNFSDDTQVYVVNGIVQIINVVDPSYETPRGLKPGESEERIIELYGEPDNKDEEVWGYCIDGYELLTIVLYDGVVSQIQIEYEMWESEVF